MTTSEIVTAIGGPRSAAALPSVGGRTPEALGAPAGGPARTLAEVGGTGLDGRGATVQLEAGSSWQVPLVGLAWISPQSGVVVMSTRHRDGRAYSRILARGDIAACGVAVDAHPEASVRAIVDSTVTFVAGESLAELTREPRWSVKLLEVLSREVRARHAQALWLSNSSCTSRVAAVVCDLVDRVGSREEGCHVVRHGLTYPDMASLAVVGRREVSRTLSSFRDRAWLTSSPGLLVVRDLDALRRVRRR